MQVDDDLHALLDEQRREIAAAETVDGDLLFAFQLQMQEAMSASNSKPAINGESIIGSNDVTTLFSEELLNYEQQFHDRQTAEAEMKKIEDDLNRRIHDQAFAREIQSVPEGEWKETGDHLHRPYGEGSSKGGAQNGNEDCFRVYVKGLMGEEVEEESVAVVVGTKQQQQLAGIGVAVCDPSGILVFEVSKGLGESTTEVLNDEIVELKALIEGLDVAVMLGLKRVNVVLDSQTILQYVRGKLHPRNGNVIALVEQATSHLRKFTDCVPSLVSQNTVNFAIKLATDAIVSQVRGPAESSLQKSITETCTICLQDTDVDHMFLINGCLHYYCFSCMNKHVEAKLLQGMLPECPHDKCKSGLKIDNCKKFLTPKLYDLMNERVKETTIPITEKIYCPNPKCSTLMSKSEVQITAPNAFVGNEQVGARMCTKCRLHFCINCRVPWHQNMTCFDYRRLNPYLCVDDVKLKSLATKSLWRQCVKCNHIVSLGEGCYHIYCRCGHEFCYTCGAEWKNKKPTCSCPIWDERNIIYGNRPQPRRG
ncbi:PREDICTED: probable E3 ubiquitin-protein ligase ARI9 [Nicotiana attenuata]|uniref:RBR-type E3 ubiquitin transferase n=1 Tax=Nicotiana attenuata TaxID=49451 RepID=A0A314KTB6_NICAT|nr:PREDICTED: probable E3 ubiquitin-protein ligase ARI9 [Nicotiana attenuata]OIT32560.1 atp-dependent rna helicase deah11, chloroplastic [Nicotiana attenuata]